MHNKKEITQLLKMVYMSETTFYRDLWGDTFNKKFVGLPVLTAELLAQTALENRLYKKIRGLTKIIHRRKNVFLAEFDLSDITAEEYGINCKRPLVLLADGHDSLEKTFWFYEQNILPLIGEITNLSVTAYNAGKYEIDGLLIDHQTFVHFLPLLAKERDLSCIEQLTILNENFIDVPVETVWSQFPNARFVWGFSEAGALAISCPEQHITEKKLVFHPTATTYIESDKQKLIVTKTTLFPTPIIRYQTEVSGSFTNKKLCNCGKKALLLSVAL